MQEWDRLAKLEQRARDEMKWSNQQIAKASAKELELALQEFTVANAETRPEKVVDMSSRFPNAPTGCNGPSILGDNALLDLLITCYGLGSNQTVSAESILGN